MIQVYARADAAGRVEELGSSVFLKDPSGWTLIDEGEGRPVRPRPGTLSGQAADGGGQGTHNYMLDGSTIREATSEEKEAEKAAFPQPGTEPGGTAGSAGGGAAIAGGRAFGGE